MQYLHQDGQDGEQGRVSRERTKNFPPNRDAWHLGAYSSSSYAVSNRGGQESPSVQNKQILACAQSPERTPAQARCLSPSHQSPEDHKKIGYNKCASTPKTPEQLMSNFRLDQKEARLMQSKSNSGSGHKTRLCPFASGVTGAEYNGANGQNIGNHMQGNHTIEIQGRNVHKIGLNNDLEIGQEVLNEQPCGQ